MSLGRPLTYRPLVLAPFLALLAGLAVGWLDVGASEVQGPLLLLMVAAFAISLLSRAPAWLIAIATTVGLPLAHVIMSLVTGAGDAQWGMLVALIPASLAAYGGKGVASLIATTSGTLVAADRETPTLRWYARDTPQAHLLGAALLGCAIVGGVPVYAASVARGQPFAWWLTIVWQIISLLAWALAAPLVLRMWQRVRGTGVQGISPLEISSHAAIVAAIALLHAVLLPIITRLLLVPLGPRGVPGAAVWALAAYLPLDALTYCLIIGLGHASDTTRRAAAAAARENAVRGELATTRLASLRAQLRPHFLFNALNAATVLARRDDADGTARVLGQLAELLRYVLRGADEGVTTEEMVRLSNELEFAEAYLAIERERFPDRLRTSSEIALDTRTALVPHLLLQPLVENAVQHGIGTRVGIGTVLIRAWRIEDVLHVAVEDDGSGITATARATGIGLSNTRSRLATLYGERAALTLAERPAGGVVAHVTLPYRT